MKNIERILSFIFALFLLWYIFNSYVSLISFYIPFLETLRVGFVYPQKALDFLYAISDTKYLFYLIQAICVIAGVLLIINRYATLALLLVLPITFNILLFTLLLAPGFLLIGGLVFGVNVLLLFFKRHQLKGIFKKK